MRETDLADPTLVMVGSVPAVKWVQWPNEAQAVVFHESSGDTFEVNAIAATFIAALGPEPVRLEALLAICDQQHSTHYQQAPEQFINEYIVPLQTLDIVRVRNL